MFVPAVRLDVAPFLSLVHRAWNNLPSGITCSPPLLTLKRERLKCTYSALLPRSLAF